MALDRNLVEDAIFGWRGSQRFTQDSPVLPDVWIEYALRPGHAVGLLLEPSAETSPAKIYRALADQLDEQQVKDARLAENRTTVAVDMTLAQLIQIVLPLTQWWVDCDKRGLSPASVTGIGPLQVFPALARQGAASSPDDISVAEEFMADLVALAETRDATYYAPAMVYLIHIVGLVACAQADPERVSDLEKIYKASGPQDFFANNLSAIVAAVRVGWNHLQNQIQPPSLSTGSALLWTVNRNRRATISLASSVLSVKADAARRLFNIDTSKITWAVVDSGVDARHPAFLDLSDSEFARRYRAHDVTYTELLAKSRVTETYDFSFVRDLLVDPDGAPAHYKLADGFQLRAKDLKDRLREGRDIDWQPLVPILQINHDENYIAPHNAHGTHVAGIIGSNLAATDNPRSTADLIGMCPHIRLIDIRVFDRNGQSEEFALLSALQFLRYLNSRRDYIVVHGANLSFSLRHDVANFACGRTPICHEADRLVESGIVIVAAAGNNGYMKLQTTHGEVHEAYNGVSITDPGNAESVITVGSTHRAEPHNYGVSYFSSRGPTGDGRYKPDLVAPGEKILSCVTNRGVQAMDGTSMAAPHVSGAAALLMARHREFIGQPRRIKEILCKTATDLGRERYFQGSGLLDVLRALQSV
jgi:subtilisin family serine protease